MHRSLIHSAQKSRNNPNVHQLMNGQTNADIYTLEYYSVIKNNKVLIHTTTWMNIKNMKLSERIQPWKDHMLCDSIYIKCPGRANPQIVDSWARGKGNWE